MSQGILVVALPQRGALAPVTYELLSAGRTMADALKQPLCAVVVGGSAATAQDLVDSGAEKVFLLDSPALENFNDELAAKAVSELAMKASPACSSPPRWRPVPAARLAVKLKAGLAAEVSEIDAAAGKVTRSTYCGNLTSEVELKSAVQVLTVAPMSFPRAEKQGARSGQIVPVAFDASGAKMEFISFQAEESNEIDLGAAERIVAGGRGLGSAEGFKLIRDFAQNIGAAVGASRAVVDSGWIAYRHQVGLTGRAVRPKLYVACGISGQIQHLAGMSSAGNIVAINTDAECPMMQVASISVVGDLNELIPLIVEEIKKRKGAPVAA